MANVYKPEQASSLAQFINLGKDIKITYNNYSIKNTVNGISYPIHNIIHDYIDEIKEKRILVTLSDEEYLKYKFKPRLLAYDIYGNGELYFILLAINDMIDIKNFDLKKIYMLKKEDINLINKIYIAEKKYLVQNDAE